VLALFGQRRLDFGHRRRCLGGQHQFLRLVEPDAAKPGDVEPRGGFDRASEAGLGAAADDL